MEYPKPAKREAKKSRKIPSQTPKRAELERKMKEAYNKIAEEREPYCEGCGDPMFEHSHRFPKEYKGYKYIAVPEAIDLYCRVCHHNYENGRLWLLENGEAVLEYLESVDKDFHARKMAQMDDRFWDDRAYESDNVPGWALTALMNFNRNNDEPGIS